jgi:hypothetical protein
MLRFLLPDGAPKDVHLKKGGPAWGTILDEVWADKAINLSDCHSEKCSQEYTVGEITHFVANSSSGTKLEPMVNIQSAWPTITSLRRR